MRANQLRLWFASMAYALLCALRRIGLAHTQFAQATCGGIRLKLLKIGPSACLPSGYAGRNLRQASPWCGSACAGPRWRWPRLAPVRTSSPWPTPCSETPLPDTNQTARSRHHTRTHAARRAAPGPYRRASRPQRPPHLPSRMHAGRAPFKRQALARMRNAG
jgi:hypothetical protein